MSNVIDAHSAAVVSTEPLAGSSARGLRIAAGVTAATIAVGTPAMFGSAALASASAVREGSTKVRIYKPAPQRPAVVRGAARKSAPERDLEGERLALERLREADRNGLMWRGIKGALGLGPRVQARTPDERVSAAVDRIMSVRSRGNY